MVARVATHGADELRITWADRFWLAVAPGYGQRRIGARARVQLMARHYEAAQGGRRTDAWRRTSTDANAANGTSLGVLRDLARDLRRNNGWARRGIEAITNNTVGEGIKPKAKQGRSAARTVAAVKIWNDWADSTACDFDQRKNFYAIQSLVMDTVAEAGEALILRQPPAPGDDFTIPMRLQVLEPDYLDASRNGIMGPGGGPIINGIELDKLGRRVAYWLFTSHPGSQRLMTMRFESVRVPAERVLHIYREDRPGQLRGVSWLASAVTGIKDLDDFEDAELMQQKVAACFGAFVSDMEGAAAPLGQEGTDSNGQAIESLEPGHIEYLPPGKTVTFAQPPTAQDGKFSSRRLRRIAVSFGITYEELTGDYSQVNFSSARMARISEWQNVTKWRSHMLVPQLCDAVWSWAMDLLVELNGWPEKPRATWSAPPMPMLEPDKEGLAYQRLVRNGFMTWAQAVHELGYDPFEQLEELEAMNEEFDERGLVLDVDPRRMTQAGQVQQLKAASPSSAAASDSTEQGGDAADDGATESDASSSETADSADTTAH